MAWCHRNRTNPAALDLSCQPHGLPWPLDSMRDAVFTVSPKRQYRGIFRPTTPAHTGPAGTEAFRDDAGRGGRAPLSWLVCGLTSVYANAQVQLVIGTVTDLKGFDSLEQGQGHADNLTGMQLPVAHRQP